MGSSSSDSNSKVADAGMSPAVHGAAPPVSEADASGDDNLPTDVDCIATRTAIAKGNAGSTAAALRTGYGSKSRGKFFSTTLLALCFAFVMVRLPFVFTVPMGEAPDEFAHYWVLRFMHDHLALPNAQQVAAGGPSAVYGSLPQFGYLPHVLISLLSPLQDVVLFARFGSLLMGLILLYSAYHIGRELFPRNRLLSLALPVAIIFHPQMAFLHAYMNNDATSSAVASLLLLHAIRSLKPGGFSFWRCAFIGVLTGWLALTKYSGLGMMPPIALCLVASAFINRVGWLKSLLSFGTSAALAISLSAWWFIRNGHIYNGDYLGTHTMYVAWATTFHRPLTYYEPASHIIKNLRWWRMMFFSFWGLFGYMTKYMWRPLYFVYLGFLCAGVAGLIRENATLLLGIVEQRRLAASGTAGRLANSIKHSLPNARTIVIWSALTLAVAINLSSMIWASTTNLGGPQGRYLFTSEIPVLALMLFGLNACGVKWGPRFVIAFLVYNALVCIGAWYWLFRLYGFHAHPI